MLNSYGEVNKFLKSAKGTEKNGKKAWGNFGSKQGLVDPCFPAGACNFSGSAPRWLFADSLLHFKDLIYEICWFCVIKKGTVNAWLLQIECGGNV